MRTARTISQHIRAWLPKAGFFFDRPLVLLQSDDWGRVGVRDREGMEQLRSLGMEPEENPWDFYTMETADDVTVLNSLLRGHRDSTGRCPCLCMNFLTANLDIVTTRRVGHIHLRTLSDGLPDGWHRPGLFEAYRAGVDAGVFYPSLHGTTHFCRGAVERELERGTDRAAFMKTLWSAGTPYIFWRMPWIGYEYWDPGRATPDQFLGLTEQMTLVGAGVGGFAKMFSSVPRSACAPGYRANDDTCRAWARHGIRVVQEGPGTWTPPHWDRHDLLHVYRSVEFEPALNKQFSVGSAMQTVEQCFARGLPAVVSIHSVNFHSTVRDFRSRTVSLLDELLSSLESKYPDMLYLHDEDLRRLVETGSYESGGSGVSVRVTRRKFRMGAVHAAPDA